MNAHQRRKNRRANIWHQFHIDNAKKRAAKVWALFGENPKSAITTLETNQTSRQTAN